MSSAPSQADANERIAQAVRRQFPSWVLPTSRAGPSAAVKTDGKYADFLVSSNWILRPVGIKEFFDELQKRTTGVRVTYDLDTGCATIKCLASDQEAVMEACKSVIDRMVRGEIKSGLATSEKVTLPGEWCALVSDQQGEKLTTTLFPREIRGFSCQTAWTMPGKLVANHITLEKLVPGEELSKLQQVTGCTMMIGSDKPIMYIGANSIEKAAIVERKLNTLAKYAMRPSERDDRCESFIYAEDKQDENGALTFMEQGARSHLTTFFLDRATYRLVPEYSAYGNIFGKGVVVSLVCDLRQLSSKPASIKPAIAEDERNQPYKAFTLDYSYTPKYRSGNEGSNKALSPAVDRFHPSNNPDVSSWVQQLPTPDPTPQSGEGSKPSQWEKAPVTSRRIISSPSSQGIVEEQNWLARDNDPSSGCEGLCGTHKGRPTPRKFKETNQRGRSPSPGGYQTKETNRKPRGRQQPNYNQRARGNQYSRPYQQRRPTNQRGMNSTTRGNHQTSRVPPRSQNYSISKDPGPFTATIYPRDGGSRREGPVPRRRGDEGSQMQFTVTPGENSGGSGREPEYEKKLKELQDHIDKMAVEIVKLRDSKEEQDHGSCLVAAQAEQAPEDPFASLLNKVRFGNAPTKKKDDAPTLHATMSQQAGSRFIQTVLPQDPHVELMETINRKLVRMMDSLELFPGNVSLKAEIGRLCLTRINEDYVRQQAHDSQSKIMSLHTIKEALDMHHVKPRDILFTKILTAEGADANYLAHIKDSSAKRVWSPNTRHTIYEVNCAAMTKEKNTYKFVVEIDSRDFSYKISPLTPALCSLFVHCPKRSWDFQITLATSQDLNELYGNFAKDLVDNMQVMLEDSGIPSLEFLIRTAWQVEILLVRTRNVASYTKGGEGSASSVLEICEVHDMSPTSFTGTDNEATIKFEQYPGNRQLGQLGTWYEATIQSKFIKEALQQNLGLEFGDTASWSPEDFRKVGAFDELIRSTTEMIKNMDGIGYWGNNHQDAMIHGKPRAASSTGPRYGAPQPPTLW
ncbi:hypothetical protein AAE478_002170 [Parahypoxylon ruwenzoriense]